MYSKENLDTDNFADVLNRAGVSKADLKNDYDNWFVSFYDSANEIRINLDKLNLSKKAIICTKFIRYKISFEDKTLCGISSIKNASTTDQNKYTERIEKENFDGTTNEFCRKLFSITYYQHY